VWLKDERRHADGDGEVVMLIMSGIVVRVNVNRMLYGLGAGCE